MPLRRRRGRLGLCVAEGSEGTAEAFAHLAHSGEEGSAGHVTGGRGSGLGRDCRESPHSSGRDSVAERGGATPTRRATTEDGGAGVPVCPTLPPNVECQHRERTPTLSASDPGKV